MPVGLAGPRRSNCSGRVSLCAISRPYSSSWSSGPSASDVDLSLRTATASSTRAVASLRNSVSVSMGHHLLFEARPSGTGLTHRLPESQCITSYPLWIVYLLTNCSRSPAPRPCFDETVPFALNTIWLFTRPNRKPVAHGRATGIMVRASKARYLLT